MLGRTCFNFSETSFKLCSWAYHGDWACICSSLLLTSLPSPAIEVNIVELKTRYTLEGRHLLLDVTEEEHVVETIGASARRRSGPLEAGAVQKRPSYIARVTARQQWTSSSVTVAFTTHPRTALSAASPDIDSMLPASLYAACIRRSLHVQRCLARGDIRHAVQTGIPVLQRPHHRCKVPLCPRGSR